MRILVVDDDPDARALTVRSVGHEFPEARVDQAGEPAALDALLTGPVDILVSDYMLRWSDGFAVFERVRAISPALCAVMFTGTGSEELAVRAIKAGFDDYIVKSPQQLRRLATAVRTAFERGEAHRRLEQHRELLLRELYHRLHNNLQIVISLVQRTARTLADPGARERLADLSRRIQALSVLQESFYRADNLDAVPFDGYLERLCADHAALAPHVRIQTDLEPVTVTVQTASPLALIANELLTNALKHAFPGERSGRIQVTLRREGGRALLRVADDGVGAAGDAPSEPHLGAELIRGLARQIEAQVDADPAPQGWSTSVRFTP